MPDRILSASALVRDVADERLSHGDRMFAYGLGGLTLIMTGIFAASLLRSFGIA